MDLKSTPLIEEHRKLGAKLAPFGGWLMPIQYEGIIIEHNWTRSAASVFDICHMGEFLVYGSPAKTNLDSIVTLNLNGMKLGSCRYGFMLNEKGGIIDDIIVYRIEQEKWMIVVNAATIDTDAVHIKEHLSGGTKFENISDNTGKLDIQGPASHAAVSQLIGENINLDYYKFYSRKLLGEDVIVSRTGYTGELGFELYIKSGKTAELWNKVLQDERVRPAGLGARDTLRLEMCYPLYGQDIGLDISPVEAGLLRFVDLDKDFIGKNALLEKKKKGTDSIMSYFVADTRRAPRHGYTIFSGDSEIGVVTSGVFSPSLSRGIGMGYIKPEYFSEGRTLTIKNDRIAIDAILTDRPFYKKGTARF